MTRFFPALPEVLALLRRRAVVILAGLCVGLALAALLLARQPALFEASATLQVEAPLITGPVAGADTADLLPSLEHRLTSRENLRAMIERHGLFAQRPDMPEDTRLQVLRRAISLTLGPDSPLHDGRLVEIAVRLTDADLAARVANDLAQSILDQSSVGQRQQAEQTVAFLTEELARATQDLADLAGQSSTEAISQSQRLQDRSTQLSQTLAEAETALHLIERQQGARLTLLDRALTPDHPLARNMARPLLRGASLGLLAGLFLALILELRHPVIRTADQMQRQFGLQPMISIPDVDAGPGLRQRLLRMVDDPARPLFGLPRYAVLAGGTTAGLMLLSVLLR